jgi:aldehyde oxidoreductase
MSGGALVKAINALKLGLVEAGAKTYDELVAAGRPTKYLGTRIAETTLIDTETGQGIPFESRVHGVQMAEVEVDTETGEVRVLKITAAVDAGTVINPMMVEGQIQGGLDMGAGMALREEYVHGETKDWVSYQFPTMKTSFDMEVILLETPRKRGPLGAVGIGEFVLLPTAAAIVTAIQDATGGERIRHLPATPRRVLEAMGKRVGSA